ncbi:MULTISPECIES: FKBP-type peptidyl-prolyl cis-trans isomerase [Rhodanobacter]|jgi:FKBP-type peptidyl-prolyl cis-trans isomerase FkpA|uniref:Peptidyl-prolyl cis-trans isomerase n=1 Tax=Rhodanobacter glycinis TaxID=582702 RepID=A0A1I3XK47_9GAMM|nr:MULTISPECIES: FKBP-type peptidyl-prolyl cis-trans isomerase [Rhodanobacter]EIL98752.1 peptidylprolyl isomerase [Rhodanobacter sp. 115]QEE24285.1 FKBP-type peptidyl-prolyl cis-trans isomerase [Rhodanobacter glycinis]SFK19923.1 FKBP-type peptidyl-prolyl cis-trans isomerase FkpA [Rhodanobacter glycinis]
MRWLLPLLVLSTLFVLAACNRSAPQPYQGGSVATLTKTDLKIGTGPEAKPGMTVEVNYTGWLYDEHAKDKRGKKFDSSLDHGQPFSFTLGQGMVIKGWDEGVAGMHVGGKRLLLIPAALGYGARGAGGVIPPNASLVFEVDLLGVTPK